MFENLDDIVIHYEEVMAELGSPEVANNQDRFKKLMKEQADLLPLVETYTAYKNAKAAQTDEILDTESDNDLREMAKEELADGKKKEEELEQQLKLLLLPKDPNDDKNIMLEIRAGAGGISDAGLLNLADTFASFAHHPATPSAPSKLDAQGSRLAPL